MQKEEIYSEWVAKQKQKCLEAYADPITGKVEPENEIKALHKQCVTATMSAALLGKSPWTTKEKLFSEMTFASEEEELDPEKAFTFEIGHMAEKLIAREFMRITHQKVTSGKIEHHKDRPWSACQFDFLTANSVLECKTASHVDGWGFGCLFNENGVIVHEDGNVPEQYKLQCQKQMYIADISQMYLACWMTFERSIRIYVIHRDDALIKQIIEAEDDFMFNHVIPNVPFESVSVAPKAENQEGEDTAFTNEEISKLVARYKEISAPFKSMPTALKKEQSEIVDKIKTYLNGASKLIDTDGVELCHFTEIKPKPKFDATKFANEHPDLYGQYIVEGDSSFRFYIAKPKKSKKEVA